MIKTILPIITILALAAGCSRGGAVAPDTTVERSGDKTVVKSGDGKTERADKIEIAGKGKGLDLPADFPSDVPVYPGARIASSLSNMQNNLLLLNLESDDSVGQVSDYYEKELKAQGWELQTASKTETKGRFAGIKANRRAAVVIRSRKRQGDTNVMLNVVERPAR